MDDEAAAEQLMSEARASYPANHNDTAIPLRLDGADSARNSRKKSKKSKKLEKLVKSRKSDKPKRSHREHLAGAQISPSRLSTHTPSDLQASVVESPSKSQIIPLAAPTTQIEVPDSQVANGIPASPNNTKGKPSKRKRKRHAEADGPDEVIPATPLEAAEEAQSSQKRRKKHNEQVPMANADADAMEIEQNSYVTQRKQEAIETSPADVGAKEHATGVGNEFLDTPGAETAAITATSQSSNKSRKTKKKNKHILEASKIDQAAPVRKLDDTTSELAASQDIEVTDPTESRRKEKKRRKKLAKSENVAKPSRYGVGGLPASPKKRPSKQDPNRNYERARNEDDRTAADKALESGIDLGHPPELRTSGDYSSDENELLRRAIRDFQHREAFETADLVEIIQWIPTKEDYREAYTINEAETQLKKQSAAFWEEVKSAGLRRKMKNIKEHVRAIYHTYQRGPWSVDEDRRLRGLVELHPNQWKTIATELHRLRGDVFNRWKDYVQHGEDRVTKRWSQIEEENFVQVLSNVCQRIENDRAERGAPPLDDFLSYINWSEVCKEMGNTRSRLQCQYKLKQMRARDPPPTFDFEIKPRRTPSPVEEESESEVHANGEDPLDATPSKKGKRPAIRLPDKQAFKSKELITDSDNADSEPEA